MFYETMIETEDKSYYTDRLIALTGTQRGSWRGRTIDELKKLLCQALRARNQAGLTQKQEIRHRIQNIMLGRNAS